MKRANLATASQCRRDGVPRWRRVALALALIAATTSVTGCGTLVSSARTWPEPDWFGGVRHDSRVISDPDYSDEYPGFAAFDFPMSLVLDVGFLPINFIFQIVDWIAGDDETS